MNYQAAADLCGGSGISEPGSRTIPIGASWKRVNWALAGYGNVVAGTLSDVQPVDAAISAEPNATMTLSALPNATLTLSLRGG